MKPTLLFRFGFREFKRELRAFLTIVLSLIVSAAALFGVLSSTRLMRDVLNREAREILGGDIEVETGYPPPPELLEFLSEGEETGKFTFSPIIELASVIYTEQDPPKNLLVEIKVISEKYPLYGELLLGESQGKNPAPEETFVEPDVLARLGVKKGERIRIGQEMYTLADTVVKEPDRSLSLSVFGPRIFLSEKGFARTGLLTNGTRLEYEVDIREPDAGGVAPLAAELREILSATSGRVRTAESGPQRLERLLGNMEDFFVSVALVTVFLSAIAIAVTMTGYLQRKRRSLAIWKCLGMTQSEALSIFLFQALFAGMIGGAIGGLIGSFFPLVLRSLLQEFLPFALPFSFAWSEAGAAMIFGIILVLLSVFLPLLRTRTVEPLLLLHPFTAERSENWRAVGIPGGIVVAAGWGLIFFFLRDPWWTSVVFGGIAVTLGILTAIFWFCLSWLRRKRDFFGSLAVRTVFALFGRYLWRRLSLMAALTMSVGMILLVLLLRDNLNSGLVKSGSPESGANVIMIDVQKDQVEGVKKLLPSEVTFHPRISARIFALDGKKVDRNDPTLPREMAREFNLTYRDELIAGEKIIAGEFWSPGSEGAEVSVDSITAENFSILLGSVITFEIQGVRRDFRVTSLREVERSFTQPFFYFLMPRKALEDAPQVLFGFLRIPSSAVVSLQNEIGNAFPNILVLDVGEIVATVERINAQAIKVFLFFGLFIFLAGLLLLIGMVQSTALERRRDIVLMKVLGASSGFLRSIAFFEFGFYAVITGGFGFLLAAIGTSILNEQVFQTVGIVISGETWKLFLILIFVVILVGWLQLHLLLRRSPRDLLQERGG